MTDETLVQILGSLRAARMDAPAADRVREQLEKAWRDRAARPRRRAFAVPAFARAAIAAAVTIALAYGTMHAGAETPIYAARIAIEDALVAIQSDPVAYVSDLYAQRVEEASRHEATGNALAASRARAATDDALRLLRQISGQPDDNEPEPSPTEQTVIAVPSASPTPQASVEPTPPATATPRPATARPTATNPPTPKPTATPTPKPATPRPSPTPTPSAMIVHATGDVLYADGSRVNGACVSLVGYGVQCIAGTVDGRVSIDVTAKKGQTLVVYFENYDAARGGTLKGKASVTVGGTTVNLGTVTLRPV